MLKGIHVDRLSTMIDTHTQGSELIAEGLTNYLMQ